MKVFLPAIEGHVPAKMVHAVRDLIEFTYLVRRDVHDTQSLAAIDTALKSFHNNREIFKTSGVVKDFNYPRQHSLKHYVAMIRAFGSPNGLCSSMTENKHIDAVKKPWRRSNHFNAVKQMLLTNQRLDKLSASRAHFTSNGMLEGTCLSDALAKRSKFFICIFKSTALNNNVGQSLAQLAQLEQGKDAETNDNAKIIDADTIAELNRAARVADEDEDDEDDYDVNGPRAVTDIDLAKTVGAW
jgi:hypothetical protein